MFQLGNNTLHNPNKKDSTIVSIINPREDGSFRKKVLMKINSPDIKIMDAMRSKTCMAVIL